MPNSPKKAAIRYFGDYALLGEIARGGMGVVYQALQVSLDRDVAIKMIDDGKLADHAASLRFRAEAQAMAKLDHPNIVSIYEVGEHEGQQYLSMKLVDGPNLAEHIASKPLEPHQAVSLLLTVARAVQYAHDRGVLHRDLKPSNILLDAQGQPHVTDFGIAKLVERAEGYTGSVAMLGTPEYMAPEQAVGRTREATPAADIYSLGAVLYHLLTGQPPFKAGTALETLHRVIHEEAASPRSLNPDVDSDLETICLKCLRKEPKQRYLSARALALDLQRWLSHRPIDARPVPGWARGCKWVHRHPLASALSTAVVLGVALSAAGFVWHWSWNEMLKSRKNETLPGATPSAAPGPAPSNIVSNSTMAGPDTPPANVVSADAPQPITAEKPSTPPPSANTELRWEDSPEPPKPPELAVKLVTRPTPSGYIKTAPSGQHREIMDKKLDGIHTQYFSPTGRLQREVVQKPDRTQQTTFYKPNGTVYLKETINKDGTKETTRRFNDREGRERARETIKADANGKEISKTAFVNACNSVKNYDRGQYGFAYRPAQVGNSSAFFSWYDPYWYGPGGKVNAHPFRYSWDWKDYDWYWIYQSYWTAEETYPAPSYWMTDWLIASYLADRYAASVSTAQERVEAQLARGDARKAKVAAEQAKDKDEIAEARAAQHFAEQRAAQAEARAAKADADENKVKALTGKSNPQATPIDSKTKEVLREQIEETIAEHKAMAEHVAKGGQPVIPDLARTFADPKHLYIASKAFSITLANENPAGKLTEGDLLKLVASQERALTGGTERTLVDMRVISSKGEEGEVRAGDLISVPLKLLQEFDSEFRAKLDLGLAEAEKSKDLFKKKESPPP